MRVYIAGALASSDRGDRTPSKIVTDYICNLRKMCLAARQVQYLGHSPYIPGLDFLYGLVVGDLLEEDYRNIGIDFLEVCHCVLVTSWSTGVAREIKRAKECNKPVYYDISELPHA